LCTLARMYQVICYQFNPISLPKSPLSTFLQQLQLLEEAFYRSIPPKIRSVVSKVVNYITNPGVTLENIKIFTN
jgi:hypothetical protein